MLVILTSHPIQYQAPIWRFLAQTTTVPFEVWFLTPHALKVSADSEFGNSFAWDIDLLDGYKFRFLELTAPYDLNKFNGIRMKDRWFHLLKKNGATHLWIEGWRFRVLWTALFAAKDLGIEVW